MRELSPGVHELSRRLQEFGWVTELLVGGSAATGDYRHGVSDLDLVALVTGPVVTCRTQALAAMHRELDAGSAAGFKLGCVYVDAARVNEPDAVHPTWTHGSMLHRRLSGVARAELVRHGYAVFGRSPQSVFSPVGDDDVRHAARAELLGYWAQAVHHPRWLLTPGIAELSLTDGTWPARVGNRSADDQDRCRRPGRRSLVAGPEAA